MSGPAATQAEGTRGQDRSYSGWVGWGHHHMRGAVGAGTRRRVSAETIPARQRVVAKPRSRTPWRGAIPARAGSSRVARPRQDSRRGHPRGCGEQTWPGSAVNPPGGPSHACGEQPSADRSGGCRRGRSAVASFGCGSDGAGRVGGARSGRGPVVRHRRPAGRSPGGPRRGRAGRGSGPVAGSRSRGIEQQHPCSRSRTSGPYGVMRTDKAIWLVKSSDDTMVCRDRWGSTCGLTNGGFRRRCWARQARRSR